MKTRAQLWCVLALLSAMPTVSPASRDPVPPITSESILGTWEAVYVEDTIRVFRLEIRRDGPSLLAQGLAHKVGFVDKLERMTIESGKLDLVFRSDLRRGSYEVEGRKYTKTGITKIIGQGTEGDLDVELIMEPDAPHPKVWKLRFFKSDESSLTKILTEYAVTAEEAARRGTSSVR